MLTCTENPCGRAVSCIGPQEVLQGRPTELGEGAVSLYYFFSSKSNVLIFVNPDNSKILKQKDFVLLVLRELER